MNGNERVILIKGDATKWYDQAIFIVNKQLPKEAIPVDFVAEAEKVINEYIKKSRRSGCVPQTNANTAPVTVQKAKTIKKKKNVKATRFDFVLNAVMLVGCLVIAGVFLMGML